MRVQYLFDFCCIKENAVAFVDLICWFILGPAMPTGKWCFTMPSSPPSGNYRGFSLSCYYPTPSSDLTNSRFTQILDNYLSAGITSLSLLTIYGATSLTALSPQLSRFSNMESIEIYTSAIRDIPSNSFILFYK